MVTKKAGLLENPLLSMLGFVLVTSVTLRCHAQTAASVSTNISQPQVAASANSAQSEVPGGAASTNLNVRAEQIRTECIQGRRMICGKIVQILPDGLVVESGYPSLLRPEVDRTWLVPGTVIAARDPKLVEGRVPGEIAVGLVFLTDLPRSRGVKPKPKPYDYVVIQAYPAGQYTYTSVGTIQRTVRRFSCGLETAVKLNLKAEGGQK